LRQALLSCIAKHCSICQFPQLPPLLLPLKVPAPKLIQLAARCLASQALLLLLLLLLLLTSPAHLLLRSRR
jgi:hypothetical protein